MPHRSANRRLRRFLILAATVTLLALVGVQPAQAVTWLGFFPAIPNVPGGPPTFGPTPDTPPTIPPIFNWPEPLPPGPGDHSGPTPDSPPGTIAPSPEPATMVGGLIGLSVVGVVSIWRRRKSR